MTPRDWDTETCAECGDDYLVAGSDAHQPGAYCSRDCERDAADTPDEDTGRYCGGYRVYRDGSYREDFGGDR